MLVFDTQSGVFKAKYIIELSEVASNPSLLFDFVMQEAKAQQVSKESLDDFLSQFRIGYQEDRQIDRSQLKSLESEVEDAVLKEILQKISKQAWSEGEETFLEVYRSICDVDHDMSLDEIESRFFEAEDLSKALEVRCNGVQETLDEIHKALDEKVKVINSSSKEPISIRNIKALQEKIAKAQEDERLTAEETLALKDELKRLSQTEISTVINSKSIKLIEESLKDCEKRYLGELRDILMSAEKLIAERLLAIEKEDQYEIYQEDLFEIVSQEIQAAIWKPVDSDRASVEIYQEKEEAIHELEKHLQSRIAEASDIALSEEQISALFEFLKKIIASHWKGLNELKVSIESSNFDKAAKYISELNVKTTLPDELSNQLDQYERQIDELETSWLSPHSIYLLKDMLKEKRKEHDVWLKKLGARDRIKQKVDAFKLPDKAMLLSRDSLEAVFKKSVCELLHFEEEIRNLDKTLQVELLHENIRHQDKLGRWNSETAGEIDGLTRLSLKAIALVDASEVFDAKGFQNAIDIQESLKTTLLKTLPIEVIDGKETKIDTLLEPELVEAFKTKKNELITKNNEVISAFNKRKEEQVERIAGIDAKEMLEMFESGITGKISTKQALEDLRTKKEALIKITQTEFDNIANQAEEYHQALQTLIEKKKEEIDKTFQDLNQLLTEKLQEKEASKEEEKNSPDMTMQDDLAIASVKQIQEATKKLAKLKMGEDADKLFSETDSLIRALAYGEAARLPIRQLVYKTSDALEDALSLIDEHTKVKATLIEALVKVSPTLREKEEVEKRKHAEEEQKQKDVKEGLAIGQELLAAIQGYEEEHYLDESSVITGADVLTAMIAEKVSVLNPNQLAGVRQAIEWLKLGNISQQFINHIEPIKAQKIRDIQLANGRQLIASVVDEIKGCEKTLSQQEVEEARRESSLGETRLVDILKPLTVYLKDTEIAKALSASYEELLSTDFLRAYSVKKGSKEDSILDRKINARVRARNNEVLAAREIVEVSAEKVLSIDKMSYEDLKAFKETYKTSFAKEISSPLFDDKVIRDITIKHHPGALNYSSVNSRETLLKVFLDEATNRIIKLDAALIKARAYVSQVLDSFNKVLESSSLDSFDMLETAYRQNVANDTHVKDIPSVIAYADSYLTRHSKVHFAEKELIKDSKLQKAKLIQKLQKLDDPISQKKKALLDAAKQKMRKAIKGVQEATGETLGAKNTDDFERKKEKILPLLEALDVKTLSNHHDVLTYGIDEINKALLELYNAHSALFKSGGVEKSPTIKGGSSVSELKAQYGTAINRLLDIKENALKQADEYKLGQKLGAEIRDAIQAFQKEVFASEDKLNSTQQALEDHIDLVIYNVIPGKTSEGFEAEITKAFGTGLKGDGALQTIVQKIGQQKRIALREAKGKVIIDDIVKVLDRFRKTLSDKTPREARRITKRCEKSALEPLLVSLTLLGDIPDLASTLLAYYETKITSGFLKHYTVQNKPTKDLAALLNNILQVVNARNEFILNAKETVDNEALKISKIKEMDYTALKTFDSTYEKEYKTRFSASPFDDEIVLEMLKGQVSHGLMVSGLKKKNPLPNILIQYAKSELDKRSQAFLNKEKELNTIHQLLERIPTITSHDNLKALNTHLTRAIEGFKCPSKMADFIKSKLQDAGYQLLPTPIETQSLKKYFESLKAERIKKQSNLIDKAQKFVVAIDCSLTKLDKHHVDLKDLNTKEKAAKALLSQIPDDADPTSAIWLHIAKAHFSNPLYKPRLGACDTTQKLKDVLSALIDEYIKVRSAQFAAVERLGHQAIQAILEFKSVSGDEIDAKKVDIETRLDGLFQSISFKMDQALLAHLLAEGRNLKSPYDIAVAKSKPQQLQAYIAVVQKIAQARKQHADAIKANCIQIAMQLKQYPSVEDCDAHKGIVEQLINTIQDDIQNRALLEYAQTVFNTAYGEPILQPHYVQNGVTLKARLARLNETLCDEQKKCHRAKAYIQQLLGQVQTTLSKDALGDFNTEKAKVTQLLDEIEDKDTSPIATDTGVSHRYVDAAIAEFNASAKPPFTTPYPKAHTKPSEVKATLSNQIGALFKPREATFTLLNHIVKINQAIYSLEMPANRIDQEIERIERALKAETIKIAALRPEQAGIGKACTFFNRANLAHKVKATYTKTRALQADIDIEVDKIIKAKRAELLDAQIKLACGFMRSITAQIANIKHQKSQDELDALKDSLQALVNSIPTETAMVEKPAVVKAATTEFNLSHDIKTKIAEQRKRDDLKAAVQGEVDKLFALKQKELNIEQEKARREAEAKHVKAKWYRYGQRTIGRAVEASTPHASTLSAYQSLYSDKTLFSDEQTPFSISVKSSAFGHDEVALLKGHGLEMISTAGLTYKMTIDKHQNMSLTLDNTQLRNIDGESDEKKQKRLMVTMVEMVNQLVPYNKTLVFKGNEYMVVVAVLYTAFLERQGLGPFQTSPTHEEIQTGSDVYKKASLFMRDLEKSKFGQEITQQDFYKDAVSFDLEGTKPVGPHSTG